MTNLREAQAYRLFDMLDIDQSGICMLWRTCFLVHVYIAHPEQPTDNCNLFLGNLEFDEFYVLMCILIAIKDGREKEFLFKHSRVRPESVLLPSKIDRCSAAHRLAST